MTRKCIICRQIAGSKEHVFPAALGGRRVNKGIYCRKHNKDFGVHVSALLEALGFLNAHMGVRSDHHDAPKPFIVQDEYGDRYQLLKDSIEIVPPPPLSETPELIGKAFSRSFSSRKQYDLWAAEQRKLGFIVSAEPTGSVQKKYFSKPLKISLTFGTDQFKRAVAYVALTYLAHNHPLVARQGSLGKIKSYVKGAAPSVDRVWWINPEVLPHHKDASFKTVHSVSVSVSRESNEASAVVCFFGKLCLAVDLGRVNVPESICITTAINPLEDRAYQNKDVKIYKEVGTSLSIGSAIDGRNYLRGVVGSASNNPVGEILAVLHHEHLREFITQSIGTLMGSAGLSDFERNRLVGEFVELSGQRIFNLLCYGINELLNAANYFPPDLRTLIAESISGDSNMESGISARAASALELAKSKMAEEICRLLVNGQMSEDALRMLFSDGIGVVVVTKPVVDEIINAYRFQGE